MVRIRNAVASCLAASFVVLLAIAGCEKPIAEPSSTPSNANASQASTDGGSDAADTERVKAEFGVGAKGKAEGSPLRVTANAYFNTNERIQFARVESAMNLYNGAHGRRPKSHEEFMESIIEANQIQLPELPEGHRYVYDPDTETLMVERPAQR